MKESMEVQVARVQERLKAMDKALELQATEYARRLESLNHAHARAEKIQESAVQREYYDEKHAELQRRVEVVERAQASELGGSRVRAATLAFALTALGLFMTLVIAIANYLTT